MNVMSKSTCLTPEGISILPAIARHDSGQTDMDIKDWDAMFRAVLERLRQAVGEVPVVMPGLKVTDPAGLIPCTVMECVEALEQLHTVLKQERNRNR
jgi:hypothetical protein